MAIDPVCGMEVNETTAEWKSVYQEQTYYFCAPGCKRSFEKDPEAYVGPDRKPFVSMEDDSPSNPGGRDRFYSGSTV